MNLSTQLSSGTVITKFLERKQMTLLSPSTTLNLVCTSLMIGKYERNSKDFIYKKLEKMSLTCNSKIILKKRSTLELNQTSSSEIFSSMKHIRHAIESSNKSSAPGPDCITVGLVENGGEQLLHCLTHLIRTSQVRYFLGYFPKFWKKENVSSRKRIKKTKMSHRLFCL